MPLIDHGYARYNAIILKAVERVFKGSSFQYIFCKCTESFSPPRGPDLGRSLGTSLGPLRESLFLRSFDLGLFALELLAVAAVVREESVHLVANDCEVGVSLFDTLNKKQTNRDNSS